MKPLFDREDKQSLMVAAYQVKDLLEDSGRLPLLLAVSGSHCHGLERPDSDIDIRGVYLDPTAKVLNLHPGKDTFEGTRGKIDYQCYELGKLLSMLLKSNGNVVRLLLSPYVMYSVPSIHWSSLARKFTTKKLRFYYRGYAESQRKRAMSQRGGKALIYTYREIFEGLAVMLTGEPIWGFRELWDWVCQNGFYKKGLLNRYFPYSKNAETSEETWHEFYREWEDLCLCLDSAAERSSLPESYDGLSELNQLLWEWRLKGLFLPEANPAVRYIFGSEGKKGKEKTLEGLL